MKEMIELPFVNNENGKIDCLNAKISQAQVENLIIDRSNIIGPQYRFLIQLRSDSADDWNDTGVAIEQYQKDGFVSSRVVILNL